MFFPLKASACCLLFFLFRTEGTLTVAAFALSPIRHGLRQQGEMCTGIASGTRLLALSIYWKFLAVRVFLCVEGEATLTSADELVMRYGVQLLLKRGATSRSSQHTKIFFKKRAMVVAVTAVAHQ